MASKWVERIWMVMLLIALGLIVVPLYFPEVFEWLPNGEFLCYVWVVFAFLMVLAILVVTKPWRPPPGADPPRRIPRGPEDWGALLYEEEWILERRVRDPGLFKVLVTMAVIAGSALLLAIIGRAIIPITGGTLGALVLVGIVMGSISWYGLIVQLRQRPFRIYEAGVTRVVAPFDRAGLNMDFLIPTGAITSIDLEPAGRGYSALVFVFNVEGGRQETMRVSSELMEREDEPLLVLNELMGEKMSEDLKRYIASKGG